MKNISVLLILLIASLLLGACGGSSEELTIQSAWARPASVGANGAAYFVIENGAGTDDTLLSVSSEIASATEVHMSMEMDGGVMSMQMQESVPVPAKGKVEFKPGGLHVMFVELTQDLKVGETIILVFNFEHAGAKTIEVPIREP